MATESKRAALDLIHALAASLVPKTQAQQAAIDRLIALAESDQLPEPVIERAKPAESPMAQSIAPQSMPSPEPDRLTIDKLIGEPPRRPMRSRRRGRHW